MRHALSALLQRLLDTEDLDIVRAGSKRVVGAVYGGEVRPRIVQMRPTGNAWMKVPPGSQRRISLEHGQLGTSDGSAFCASTPAQRWWRRKAVRFALDGGNAKPGVAAIANRRIAKAILQAAGWLSWRLLALLLDTAD